MRRIGHGDRVAAVTCALVAVALGGCGAGAGTPARSSPDAHGPARGQTSPPPPSDQRAFSWLRPRPAPPGWPTARLAGGTTMAYPPGWLRIAGDPGTVSVALYGPHRAYLGYLNLTPRQGSEALSNWTRFRIGHNVQEGDRNVEPRSVGTGLRFALGRGSCVRDLYTGTTGVRYEELACLVAARRGAAVIVGASPPRAWARISPLLETAISTLRA